MTTLMKPIATGFFGRTGFLGRAGLLRGIGCVALAGLVATGCSKREFTLPGERVDLRDPVAGVGAPVGEPLDAQTVEAGDDFAANASEAADAQNVSRPFAAPAQVNHASWSHRNGSALHRVQHPAFSATPELIWSSDIGAGNSRRYVLTSDPVIADGRIFTLDARSKVVATSTSGARLWSQDMTPGFDRNEATGGGGLALENGVLYVTTGFGTVSALDAASGDLIWTQRLDGAATGAPTVAGDLLYLVSRDGNAWAISLSDGRVRWSLPGLPSESGVSGGAGVAVNERIAVFPYSSGDVVAAFPRGGVRLWAASLAGQRRGRVYAEVTDITGDPVIDGDLVYAGSSSGRLAALSLQGGGRVWTATEGVMGPVWPAADAVFAITDQAELVRLDASGGDRVWGVQLPYFTTTRLRRRQEIYPHFGPMLAGGAIWVASGDGKLRSYAPEDGALQFEADIPGGAASAMAVVDGTLYLMNTRGQLLAYR